MSTMVERDAVSKKIEVDAQRYQNRYGDVMESVSQEMERRYMVNNESKYQFSTFDQYALGRYAEMWESMIPIFEQDETSRAHLGEILKSGLDLVALQYATLPIQFLASVQPLTEEAGVVYYRKAIATTSRANIVEGDELISETGKLNKDVNEYISEEQVTTAVADSSSTACGPGPFSMSLPAPVRPRTITITVGSRSVRGLDDGEGNIVGVGVDPDGSSINYNTGALVLQFTNNSGVQPGDTISVVSTQIIPQAAQIPGFRYDIVGRTVNVRYYLLQAQYTSIANYVVRRRFGKSLSDDIARDTVAQVNGVVLLEAIKKLYIAAQRNEVTYNYTLPTWDSTPPSGVSDIDHRRTFTDLIEYASNKIEDLSGRSAISFMVIGQKARQIMNSIGFAGERKQVPGPYLAGFFEGIPVYYATNTILPDDEIIFGYRGLMWYESPLVYGPFMPTTVVKTAGVPNPFVEAYGVAHGAAIDTVMNEFVVRGKIDQT